jgi:hypothetical protein
MQSFKKLLVSLFLFTLAVGQLYPAGYNLQVRVDGLQDTTLLLAYHLGNRKFIKDTIRVDNSGYGVFTGQEALPGGIYLVVLPEMNYFEIIIDKEQDFTMETSLEDPVGRLKISGSEENQRFLDYHRFMNRMQTASGGLRERLQKNQNNPDSVGYLQARLADIDNQVHRYPEQPRHAARQPYKGNAESGGAGIRYTRRNVQFRFGQMVHGVQLQ